MHREKRLALIGLAATAVVAVAFGVGRAYQNGHLWKTTIPLSDAADKWTVCSLHAVPLEIEEAKNFGIGCVEYSIEYLEAMREGFPNANTDPTLSSSPDPKVGWVMIKYCPTCRQKEKDWNTARRPGLDR